MDEHQTYRGLTPEQMAAALNQGGLAALSKQLSEQDAAVLAALLRDPQKTRELLERPDVKQLLQTLRNKG